MRGQHPGSARFAEHLRESHVQRLVGVRQRTRQLDETILRG